MVQVQDSMIGAASVGVGCFGQRSIVQSVVVVRWCDCNMCVLKRGGEKTKRAHGPAIKYATNVPMLQLDADSDLPSMGNLMSSCVDTALRYNDISLLQGFGAIGVCVLAAVHNM